MDILSNPVAAVRPSSERRGLADTASVVLIAFAAAVSVGYGTYALLNQPLGIFSDLVEMLALLAGLVVGGATYGALGLGKLARTVPMGRRRPAVVAFLLAPLVSWLLCSLFAAELFAAELFAAERGGPVLPGLLGVVAAATAPCWMVLAVSGQYGQAR